MKLFTTYLISLGIFLLIDSIWLGLLAKKFYAAKLAPLLKPAINWPVALLVYILFTAALTIMVIAPAVEKQSLQHALIYGALFGFITYATYDLTNYATLNYWPLSVTIIDTLWGMFITTTVSSLTYLVARNLA